jgi:sulfotransferase
MKKFHFISGLPRSGSTLLSAVLKQNPRFKASISSPLRGFVGAVISGASAPGYRVECPPEKTKKILTGLFDNYYDDTAKQVFFNTNRGWGTLLPMLSDLFPSARVLMCVRSISWVLDSFERLHRKNLYGTTKLFSPQDNQNVYTRCQAMMRPNGLVGGPMTALKQAITSEQMSRLFMIEYDLFVKSPEETMRSIYKFIDEPYFEHDFSNVEDSYDEYDEDFQAPGLHVIRRKIEYTERQPIIPPDIWKSVQGMEVWRQRPNSNQSNSSQIVLNR